MSKLQMLGAFFVLFAIVYAPALDTFLGPMLDISLLVSMFLIIGNVVWGRGVQLDRFTLQLLMFPVLIFGVCLLNVLLLDTENVQHSFRALMRPIRVLIVLSAVAIFARYFVRNIGQNAVEKGIMLLFVVIMVHAGIMVLQFFDVEFRNMVYQFTTAKNVLPHYQSTRMAGLAGAGGAQLSIVQSFGLILGVFLFTQSKTIRTKIFVFLGCQLIIVSIFLAGRSGFLTAIIFSPLYYLYLSLQQSSFRAIKNIAITAIFVSVVATTALVFLFESMTENIFFMSVFERTFDSILGYQRGETLRVNTLVALSNMFTLPSEPMHLLIGRASYLNNNTLYSINTDIGYFRLVWGYGVVGSIFHYGFYIFAIYVVQGLPNLSRSEKSVPIMLLLLTLFFNSKEILVFSKMSFQISMFALFVVYFSAQRMLASSSAQRFFVWSTKA